MTETVPARLAVALTGISAAAFVDQITKWLILEVVMQPPRVIPIVPFFNLTLGYNTGVSFGLLKGMFTESPWALAALNLAIMAGLLFWASRARSGRESLALGLISGGALGNVIDRLRQGAVTDFFDFYIGSWHWPTFNMADVAIVVGAFVLVGGDMFSRRGPVASVTT